MADRSLDNEATRRLDDSGERAPVAPAPDLDGASWGHLRIEHKLGEGAFGEVFLAHDTVLHRDVALKLQRSDGIDSSSGYIDEARRLARVRHPNVLAVHGADAFNGRVGLWADLLRGETLAARLGDDRRLPPAEVLDLAGQLSAALTAVHGARLCHGDIKPANVMCEADGRYVLMDFGAAREHVLDETHHYGTPRFMSPERLRLDLPPSEADDLYALGVILYRAALGRYPQRVKDGADDPQPGGSATRIDAAALRQVLGRPFAALVAELLALDPGQRPNAQQTRARYRALLELPRRRRRRLLVGTVIASLSLGLMASLWAWRTAQEATRRETLQRERAEAVGGFLRDWLAAPRAEEQGRQVRVLDVLGDARRELDARPPGQPELRAELRLLLAQTLLNLGEFEPAAALATQALEDLPSPASGSPAQFLQLRAEALLASAADHRGEPAPARDRRDRVLAALQHSPWAGGELHISTLLEQADQQVGESAIAAANATLDEAQRLLDALADAGVRRELQALLATARLSALTADGRFAEAATVAERALADAIAAHGERHSSVFIARNRWVEALAQSGRLQEAEPPARANLEAARSWLGDEDRYTLAALVALGNVLDDAGRHDEALQFRREAVERGERMPGTSPTDRAQARINLANSLKESGQRSEAIALYRGIVEQRAGGQINPIVLLMAQSNLSEALVEDGQFAAAADNAADAVERMVETLGADHPFVGHARAMRGAALHGLGRSREGLAELEAALAIVRASIGEQNPLALDIGWYRLLALHGSGEIAAAGQAAQALLEQQRALYGDDHADTRRSRDWIAAQRDR